MKTKDSKAMKLTADEEKIVLTALNATWQAVGYDVLQATADSDGGSINRTSLPRSHVIEIVLDADYLEMYGGSRAEQKEAIAKFRMLSYAQMQRIARKTFSYSRYGL